MSTSKKASGGKTASTPKRAKKTAPKAVRSIRKAEDDYHHGDLRRALLTAAMDMLEADGLEALSLREVARRAGVSHNAPYRHFADREALLAAIAMSGFEQWGETMLKASGDRIGIGVAYVTFAVARPQLFNLMFGPQVNPANHRELATVMTRTFGIFAGQFGGGGGAPNMTNADKLPLEGARPELIAPWALVHGLAHLMLSRRMSERLTGGLDVETLTRAVLAIRPPQPAKHSG